MVSLLLQPPEALCGALAVAAAGDPKLPPPTRAAVLMALLGIAILGMLIVVIVLLGGHWARRQGRFRRGPAVPPDRTPLGPGAAPAGRAAESPSGRQRVDEGLHDTKHDRSGPTST